jgi:hypothetical protein
MVRAERDYDKLTDTPLDARVANGTVVEHVDQNPCGQVAHLCPCLNN